MDHFKKHPWLWLIVAYVAYAYLSGKGLTLPTATILTTTSPNDGY